MFLMVRMVASSQSGIGSHWYIGRTHACHYVVRVGAGFDSQVGSIFFMHDAPFTEPCVLTFAKFIALETH